MANNLNSIMSTLMNADTLKGIAKTSGISVSDVSSVLTSALPALLNGASKQSTSAKTAESFASALLNHSNNDASNIGSFFKNVDLTDGAKIVGHLLGKDNDKTANTIAKTSGIDAKTVAKVMAAAAPLLMCLIGKNAKNNSKDTSATSIASIAGSLLGKADIGSILGKLMK